MSGSGGEGGGGRLVGGRRPRPRSRQHAGKLVIVADSTELGRRAFARVCTIEETSMLFTDKDAPEEIVEQLSARGVDVLCV